MALDSLLKAVQLDWKETEPCTRKAEIKFPQDAVAEAFNDASKEAAKQAQVPGFRKGKAPISLIKAKYKDYIMEDVAKMLQQAAFSKREGCSLRQTTCPYSIAVFSVICVNLSGNFPLSCAGLSSVEPRYRIRWLFFHEQ